MVVARQNIGPNGVHSRIQLMKWNDGLFPATRQPVSMEKPGKAMGKPRWDHRSRFLGGPHQNGGKSHSRWAFKCQFEKMEVLPLFSQLNQAFSFGIVFWDKKLISNGNWGKLGPFQTTKNKDRSKKVTYALFPPGSSIIVISGFKGNKCLRINPDIKVCCHNHSVDRYIKVKKGNVLLYGLVKVSAIPFRLRDDRFYCYIRVNFTFGLLDCDR